MNGNTTMTAEAEVRPAMDVAPAEKKLLLRLRQLKRGVHLAMIHLTGDGVREIVLLGSGKKERLG